MSQNRSQSNSSNKVKSTQQELPPEIISQFIKNQEQKLLIDAQELKLKEKDLDNQHKYAEKTLDLQADLLKQRPLENRKTITRIAYIIASFLLIILIFFGVCLYLNKDQLVDKMLNVISYIITCVVSYYWGTKSNKKKDDSSSQNGYSEAEIIE
jgi:hypothetical protein